MNRIKCLILTLITILISNVCLSISSDFTLYKKIKIKDEQARIAAIPQLIFDCKGDMYVLNFTRVYKINNKGEFIDEIIKKGLGPDEIALSFKINMNESADTLVIHDHDKQKITLFNLNGRYIKTMDSPTKKIGRMLVSNNLGDYYLYIGSKKGECQLLHLDKDFKTLNCFYTYNGIVKLIPSSSIPIDSDLKGNIYATDTRDYNIQVFTRNGQLINSYASPGKYYKKLKGNAPSENKAYYKWRESASSIHSIQVIEDKALIVFYGDSKRGFDIYYDLYSLEGKKVASGIWEKDMKPVGKDRQGRLVCAKTDISDDGTDVTHWLYIYQLKPGIVK